MVTQQHSRLQGSRFLCLCCSNWFLNVFIWALVPLMAARTGTVPLYGRGVSFSVLLFAVMMFVPGPCCAWLLEWRSRKTVYLKSLLVMAVLALLGLAGGPGYQVVAFALAGLGYGVAQTALGSTLVNDVLTSPYRNKGDIVYAWAGRLGLPAGLALGTFLPRLMALGHAWLCAFVACAVAFILVAQTPVPVKAPVRMPLFTCDRFILPRTLPLVLSLCSASFVLGVAVARAGTDLRALACLGGGFLAAFLVQLCVRRHVSQLLAMAMGYALVLLGLASSLMPGLPCQADVAHALLATGAATVISRHLIDWVTQASHCQRGTAQHTCLLFSHLTFGAGFMAAVWCTNLPQWSLAAACVVSFVLYAVWTRRGPKPAAQ